MWINALIESAGGSIITDTAVERPEDIQLGLTEEAAFRAAEVMQSVADAQVGGPALSTAGEDANVTAFEGEDAGFMVNWPFVWPRALSGVEAGTLDPSVPEDYGWALYPQVVRGAGEPASLRRDQPRHRRLQPEPRLRLRGGRVRHQRGEPGLLLLDQRQPGVEGGGLRRPGGHRGVPDGAGHPRVAGAGGARDRRPRTTARSPRACSATTTRRARSCPEKPVQEAAELITAVLAKEELL